MTSLSKAGLLQAATLVIAGLALLPATVSAQKALGSITGFVRDSSGIPIPGVEVRVAAAPISVRSDTAGYFRVSGVRPGGRQVQFRRFGFEPKSLPAEVTADSTLSLAVVLDPVAEELPGMTVEEEARVRKVLSDFYDRRARGFGYFITRSQIEERNPQELSDMLRMMPGARLIPKALGGEAVLRFARSDMGAVRDCPPQYYVDGIMTHGMNIDDLDPREIEGIELYSGPSIIPPQFNNSRIGTSACGVVVVWTRVPGT